VGCAQDRPRGLTRVPGEIYVEFVRIGNSVKATAIDPDSGLEASVIGPASASQAQMTEAALRKLDYLKKKPR
jgi:hypothetical protein